jgi:hypothetical protein
MLADGPKMLRAALAYLRNPPARQLKGGHADESANQEGIPPVIMIIIRDSGLSKAFQVLKKKFQNEGDSGIFASASILRSPVIAVGGENGLSPPGAGSFR